ncbi:MAG: WD40 repeat domain-containing protein [Muribaculaceae bacterium]|nr:WD40 repeat domain-containing protein [Muribaculaceae bacterium]
MKISKIARIILVASTVVTSFSVTAQSDSILQTANRKTEYVFNQKETPIQIVPYNTIVFSRTLHSINYVRGNELYRTKKELSNLAVNPSGVNVGVIEIDKKGKKDAKFYSTSEVDTEIASLNTKKYGQPSAIAYTPDARKVLIATDKGLFIFEPRKMEFLDMIELEFTPEQMVISDNAYYLTMSAGDRVAVYNLEQKTVRRDWTYGVDVTDMAFSNGSSDFAVLTNDGILTIYDTRSFNIKNTIEDLGDGIACTFNEDGKYILVVTSPETLEIINLVRPTDRNTMLIEDGGVNDLTFVKDSSDESLLVFPANMKLYARRLQNLEPHFAKLITDETDLRMAEWEKMMPGESIEDYRLRVNDESRARQRRLFEDEISTQLAGDLLSGTTMSLGNYDRTNQVLAIDFSTMPTIYLPVPESNVTAFHNADDLVLSNVQYGLLPDDTFEIIYAQVFNKADGNTYEYNNLDRVSMDFMSGDANIVSLELLQQQQMEELRLQELREKVVQEARNMQLISNHTNIAVNSKVVPDYDADGNNILNYEVNFTYQVDPEFSAAEDFPPGKYLVNESGAASSMLKIVKEAFEGDFAQYIKAGKKLKVTISGTADASAIIRTIAYNGCYGDFVDEPVYENGVLTAISVTKANGIKENRQLAFLRAEGVKDFLQTNIENLDQMDANYTIRVDVSEGKGSEFRRITAQFTFVDVF